MGEQDDAVTLPRSLPPLILLVPLPLVNALVVDSGQEGAEGSQVLAGA